MNSLKSILGMIATEAIEGDFRYPNPPKKSAHKEESPSINYDLRLVREADGTLTWEDERVNRKS